MNSQVFVIAACAVLGFIIGDYFFGDEPNPCTTYNEMRQIHIDSNGEFGWPRGAIKECER